VGAQAAHSTRFRIRRLYLVILLFAAVIYVGCAVSPPSLMDDVDAVQAQIARNMLRSGDWVTAHLDGIKYLEKAPLIYWAMAGCYKIFGVRDWAARLPVALSAVALCWLTLTFGVWAFGKRAGAYAGLCIGTCLGLFLFTRIAIPDVMLTASIALSIWGFLRALDEQERRPRLWAFLMAASLGVGLLLKSLVAVVFPAGTALIYLAVTRQLFDARIWKRLHPFAGLLIVLAIAAPWHILATLRNPPYFDFTLQSVRGQYHGFLWFYFINEQLLRFLNLRYPHDYNTVTRLWFWLFHLLWLFPWSVYLPAVAKLSFKPSDRAGRVRLMAVCWIGFVLVFFTFSTTQEYYSMPCYPAFALLLGCAMAAGGRRVRAGTRVLSALTLCCAIGAIALLFAVRNVPTPGDISRALTDNPGAYTLSLGHMEDLTLAAFAYLRLPLAVAALAFLIGALGTLRWSGKRAFLATGMMMVLFFHAARLALVVFDPYMSSRPLAKALLRAPEGRLIINGQYYDFSSVFFYTGRSALLLNGRINNLVYGSYAPDAPQIFIDNGQFERLWEAGARCYLLTDGAGALRLRKIVDAGSLYLVAASGGKFLLTNQPLAGADHFQL
jgi:4-amino-4-deoxy-L-arabinose transferase-like glycosyltransferase